MACPTPINNAIAPAQSGHGRGTIPTHTRNIGGCRTTACPTIAPPPFIAIQGDALKGEGAIVKQDGATHACATAATACVSAVGAVVPPRQAARQVQIEQAQVAGCIYGQQAKVGRRAPLNGTAIALDDDGGRDHGQPIATKGAGVVYGRQCVHTPGRQLNRIGASAIAVGGVNRPDQSGHIAHPAGALPRQVNQHVGVGRRGRCGGRVPKREQGQSQ